MTEEDFKKIYSDTDVNGVRYFTMDKIVKDFIQTKKRIAELEEENAELKEELKDADEKVVHLACNQNKDLKRKLTKAKEIIRQFLNDYPVITKELLDKLEQFIKDSEVEK